jgi:hypothetical protein
MNAPHASLPDGQDRRYDIDWLTVLATLTIFLFHCARFFNFEDWHVKNNQLDPGLSLFVAFVAQWIMPLFFVLSGISSYHSLKSRGARRYIGNRFRRLVIPLICGTFILLIPVQVWVERVSHAQFDGGFLEFYPRYFDGLYGFGGNFAWMGLHLWYLEMLFVFTLLSLPLFLYLKRENVRDRISGAAAFFGKRGAFFLFGVPLLLVEYLVNLQPEGAGLRAFGGWSPFSYLIFFVTGYLTGFDPGYRDAMERSRFTALTLGLLASSLMFLFPVDLTPFGSFVKYSVNVLCRAFNSWFWLAALLGFGGRYLSFGNEFLKYAREAALPFYILHQTVIVLIGFYMAGWAAGVAVKYLALGLLSFAAILAVFFRLIRPFRILRIAFGMKASG